MFKYTYESEFRKEWLNVISFNGLKLIFKRSIIKKILNFTSLWPFEMGLQQELRESVHFTHDTI